MRFVDACYRRSRRPGHGRWVPGGGAGARDVVGLLWARTLFLGGSGVCRVLLSGLCDWVVVVKVRVTLTIAESVLERVDEAAWLARLSRSAFVEDVLEFSPRVVAADGSADGRGGYPQSRKEGQAAGQTVGLRADVAHPAAPPTSSVGAFTSGHAKPFVGPDPKGGK